MSNPEESEDRGSLRPHPQVVARCVEGEVVLIQLDRNSIYALNRTGARFWGLIVDGRSQSEAFEQMLMEFDVTRADLQTEIDGFLELLLREGLVVRIDT